MTMLGAVTQADGRWVPGIGDPTLVGWLTVVAYLCAAWLAWLAARHRGTRGSPTAFRWWTALAAGLLLGGINKQLDLQTLLTQTGRDLALGLDFYQHRRGLQLAFIGMLSLGAVGFFVVLERQTHALGHPVRLAFAGAILLGLFVVIRAASFHHVDHYLGVTLLSVRLNWACELGAILTIAGAAWWERRSRMENSRPSRTRQASHPNQRP